MYSYKELHSKWIVTYKISRKINILFIVKSNNLIELKIPEFKPNSRNVKLYGSKEFEEKI